MTAATQAPDLAAMTSLEELGSWADGHWPEPVRAMIQQGAGTSSSVRDNVDAWSEWSLRSHVLRDVSDLDTSTTLLGTPMRTPIAVAPSGQHTMVRPEGEVLTAQAAKEFDTLMILSAGTGRTIQDVRAVGGRTWFQFYWGRDRELVRDNLQRAVAEGCEAVCLTADLPVPPIIDARLRAAVQDIPGPPPQYVLPRNAHMGGEWDHDASLTWQDLDWLRSVVDVPIVVKGVTTREDARAAADAGVDVVVVSNHGGRTLDHAVPTAVSLVEVADALRDVDAAPEIIVDGGIRRGRDVVIALALGARAVLVGRPILWGLAADGADGVRDVLGLLERQLRTEMALIGCRNLAELSPEALAPRRVR